VTAAARLRSQAHVRHGLRPLNARRDMRAVAEVIEVAFAGRLDSSGRRMIRQMKMLGRIGWIGWAVAQIILPPAAYPLGFVWEDAGRVVGNVSLMPAERDPGRWILANVGVLPEYRRRGIARALVTSAIDLAARRSADELVLQVDVRSDSARRLYESLGFVTQATRTTWLRPPEGRLPQPAAPDSVRDRRDVDWPQEYALARALFPEGLLWPIPLTTDIFRPEALSGALGLRRTRHWAWYEDTGRMGATLTARLATEARQWRFILMVLPEVQGMAEEPLLVQALRALGPSQIPSTLDYPTGLATQTLESLGFQAERSLTWMRRDMHPGRGHDAGG
jgi:ribosomal protein S18 acetylase RimI-like enzyme